MELLEQTDSGNLVFDGSRARVLAAGRPLLTAAQRSREVHEDLTLERRPLAIDAEPEAEPFAEEPNVAVPPVVSRATAPEPEPDEVAEEE